MMKIGDIDINQVIELDFRLNVLEKIIERNPAIFNLTQPELERIRREVVEVLKKKYPNSGIEYKG